MNHYAHCENRGKFLIKFDILGLYEGRGCSMLAPVMSFTSMKKTPFTDNHAFSLL